MSDSHPAMNSSRERGAWSTSGYLMFVLFIALLALTVFRIFSFASSSPQDSEILPFLAPTLLTAGALVLISAGFYMIQPNQAVAITLFGSYLENLDPDELNTGYSLGFLYGRTAEAGSWEVGALYQDIERDAQFALFFESDFADGMTQGRGVFLQGAWVPVRNVTLKAGWFINERNYGTPSEADYERMQLDLNYRF